MVFIYSDISMEPMYSKANTLSFSVIASTPNSVA